MSSLAPNMAVPEYQKMQTSALVLTVFWTQMELCELCGLCGWVTGLPALKPILGLRV